MTEIFIAKHNAELLHFSLVLGERNTGGARKAFRECLLVARVM